MDGTMTGIAEIVTSIDMTTGETMTAAGALMVGVKRQQIRFMGDTMVISTSRMIVRSERRSDLLKTIKGILEPTRVERGCLSYRLYKDVENRNAFVLLEEWATQEDLERHIRTENEQRLLALMDLLSVQPELRFNTVSQTIGMELIEDVRKTGKTGPQGGENE